jgi:Co/Zn/Cd efflux system component
MSSDLVRWGGLAGVVAGVMFVLAGILILIAPPQRASFNSFRDYLIEIILVVAFAGTLVAIAGLHALQNGHYGRSGAAGSLITFIGYALIVVVTAATTLAGGEALHNVRLI